MRRSRLTFMTNTLNNKFALIGKNPTTLSLAMHNAAYSALGLCASYETVNTEDSSYAISLLRDGIYKGFSVTIPHKEVIFSYLDSIDKSCLLIGSTNTVVSDKGILRGYNTDYIGVDLALQDANYAKWSEPTLFLGTGGASRAAIYLALKNGTKELYLYNRSPERAHRVVNDFREFSDTSFLVVDDSQLESAFQKAILVFNCTPIGAYNLTDKDSLPPGTEEFVRDQHVIFDMVTNPNTPLISLAKARNCITISGDRMLLYQAIEQVKIFHGITELPGHVISAMEKALYLELAK